ncbi:30S ribosomal protein S17e [Candidatus Woesearchaeota archaeon]|nr:30S ribosomal protein S17e [Candidatus Woesearchaeota archaeon]
MGRIKTQLIKRTTEQLMARYTGQFTEDFTANKELVNKLVSVYSTKLRNTIAGYLTRLVRVRKAKSI